MYIEYCTPQRIADPNFMDYQPEIGEFRPTFLIDVAEWKVVPGEEATDGYHALSYSWEQSGEKFEKEDGSGYGIRDNGEHCIIREDEPIQLVTFTDLLHQMCKDFGITYLWYDKLCINQKDTTEKQNEIKQMYLIYSNARFTMALVPEINITDPSDFTRLELAGGLTEAKHKALMLMKGSSWWKRSWTLEELMVSTRILVVGRNTYFWSLADSQLREGAVEFDVLTTLLAFPEREQRTTARVLRYAHCRTSSRDHDRIFALANIFHGIIDIEINYKSDVIDVMRNFYRLLGQHDLSLMCFGTNQEPDGGYILENTMTGFDLPSWTGIPGQHTRRHIVDTQVDGNEPYTIDSDLVLRMRCRGCIIRPTKLVEENIDLEKFIAMDQNLLPNIASVTFLPNYLLDYAPPMCSSSMFLSLTEDCDECIILGVIFTGHGYNVSESSRILRDEYEYLSPVVRKDPNTQMYKVIGVIHLKMYNHFEPRESPQELMDALFDYMDGTIQEFSII